MTLEGTNTYVIARGPAYVIDPGPADEGHLERVREEAEGRGGIEAVVLTHGHADHAEGAEALDAPVHTPSEGERIGPLEAIATPGHSEDHVCLLAGSECFTGDLILGEGSSYVPPDGGSLVAYLDSLRRLQGIELSILYPGHGPPVEDPQAKIAEYIEHRLDRERKLLGALEAGERSRERLLEIAWDDVPAELRDAARIVMQAHLEKLDAEERLPGDLTD